MIEEFQNDNPVLLPNCESIKLIKNSRGYNWEIKLIKQDGQDDDNYLERLFVIENRLNDRYGPPI